MPQKAQAPQVKPNNTPRLLFTAQASTAAADYVGAREVYLTVLDINPISLPAL
jgi:hypothetical protein